MNIQSDQIDAKSVIPTTEGMKLMFSTKYAEAIPCFDKAIEISPNNWIALQARAFCKSMQFCNIPNSDKIHYVSEIVSDLTETIQLLKSI